MFKRLVCMAMTVDGAIGSIHKDRYHLPWRNSSNTDLTKLSMLIKNRAVIITRSSWAKLPNKFRNELINTACTIVLLSSNANVYKTIREEFPDVIKTNITIVRVDRFHFWETIENSLTHLKDLEVELVYIGGGQFAEEAISQAHETHITYFPKSDLPEEELIFLGGKKRESIF